MRFWLDFNEESFVNYCFVDLIRPLTLSQRKQDQTEKNQTLTGKDSLHHLYTDPHSNTRLANTQVQHTMSG